MRGLRLRQQSGAGSAERPCQGLIARICAVRTCRPDLALSTISFNSFASSSRLTCPIDARTRSGRRSGPGLRQDDLAAYDGLGELGILGLPFRGTDDHAFDRQFGLRTGEQRDMPLGCVLDRRDRPLHEHIRVFPSALLLVAGRAGDGDDPDLALPAEFRPLQQRGASQEFDGAHPASGTS